MPYLEVMPYLEIDGLVRRKLPRPGQDGTVAGGPELIGGVEHRVIRIVDYDPAWPGRFQAERGRIEAAIGSRARRIAHIGSTSVPGLAAKPIVDIQVSVPDLEDEPHYVTPLEEAGYRLRVRDAEHRMVRTPDLTVHVHICPVGSPWERRHLLFRDWLRHDTADRAAYQALKQELAARDWPDMNAYADAKPPLIADIMSRARTWAATAGWSLPAR
ncbi:protein of unknown function UPF0157 [Candidatus Protofrankia datiscae]|uniref:GrpB family protein n=2 Tax=Candidatus Protofrankia datiscae TaxID=2716812 RepID=F8B2Q7_9ACTN|nr:protein of unknown function UPF0157 [Candidatus Protofrankia datiscae]